MDLIKNSNPKALILLGNGFDIAHGYQTSYSDFYKKCKELKTLAEKGNSLCKHILEDVQGELWKDLECGLYSYSKMLTQKDKEGNILSAKKFKSEFFSLKEALFYYLDNEQNNRSVNNNPGRQVELLYNEWGRLDYQIVSFNYTFTVANYTVSPDSYNGGLDFDFNKLIYQHGSIKNVDRVGNNTIDSIVLGIDDTQEVEELHSFLYKSRQNPYDLHSLIKLMDNSDIFIVYGCSMGPSDDFYFRNLFEDRKDKLFIIYGYGDEKVKELMAIVHKYTGGLSRYLTINSLSFIDCSNWRALAETKDALSKWIKNTDRF